MVFGGIIGAILGYATASAYELGSFYTALLSVLGYAGGDAVEKYATEKDVYKAYPEFKPKPAGI